MDPRLGYPGDSLWIDEFDQYGAVKPSPAVFRQIVVWRASGSTTTVNAYLVAVSSSAIADDTASGFSRGRKCPAP
jgi:hypothetical protein